jgi:hypothetical protein
LREAEHRDAHPAGRRALEEARGEGVEVRHVVVDLALAVLARHPARPHAGGGASRARAVHVVARERLGRDDEPPAVVERLEVAEEARRELPLAVQHEPDVARAPVVGAERRVARRTRHDEVVLTHAATCR